jgi:hypothetical protein
MVSDEGRIDQENSLARVWGQTGRRPAAAKDLGFASADVFGAVCPSQSKACPGAGVLSRKIGVTVPGCGKLSLS